LINYNKILNPLAYSNNNSDKNFPKSKEELSNIKENKDENLTNKNIEKNFSFSENKFIGKKRNMDSSIFDMSFIEKEAKQNCNYIHFPFSL